MNSILFIILIAVAVLAAICAGAGAFFHDTALSRKVYLRSQKMMSSEEYQQWFKTHTFNYEGVMWFRGRSPAGIRIRSGRNETLHAYVIPAPARSDRWVICLHGYTSSPETMGPSGQKFFDRGFNSLYPSLGGHAESEHRSISMGWHDRLDIVDWCNYIVTLNPNAEIVLYGVSMGAAAAMMASGEKLPAAVRCVVEDCGFSSVWEQFSIQIRAVYKLPVFPFLYAAQFYSILADGFNFKRASCVDQVRKSITPTLFIHGDLDDLIPCRMCEELYQAASCEKELLIIKGAKHAESANVSPDIYWSRIMRFVFKYARQSDRPPALH